MLGWLALWGVIGLGLGMLIERRRHGASTAVASSIQLSTQDELGDRNGLAEAVRSLPMGLVVASESGEVFYRNTFASSFEDGPLATRSLVEAHVRDLLEETRIGDRGEKELSVYGPPAMRLRFVGSPLLAHEQRIGSVVVISDITKEHRTDSIRRDFVANVSHELKTPVGAMSVLAEALGVATDADTIARLGERIQVAALRLGETVDDLLILSAIESGEALEAVDVDISSFIADAIDTCQEQASLAGITVQGPSHVPSNSAVQGDRAQLLSALTNLISNAIKYSSQSQEVSVNLTRSDDWLDIEVADQGVGIPRADMERIFERFYRVDAARSRQSGGTGLGLSIVRHVAMNHGGEVQVRSEEGQGSIFTLRLPLRATAA